MIVDIKEILSQLTIPEDITETLNRNEDIEKELQGKHLLDLTNDTINLLARDLSLFSDYAFRFYLFEFIQLVVEGDNRFLKDAFIQNLFRSDILNEVTIRYSQFTLKEVNLILKFLQWTLKDISLNGENSPFFEWEDEINDAIIFWKSHPELN